MIIYVYIESIEFLDVNTALYKCAERLMYNVYVVYLLLQPEHAMVSSTAWTNKEIKGYYINCKINTNSDV